MHKERPMDDMNCIIESTHKLGAVWLGNAQAATNRALLRDHKIGAVLSVCPMPKDDTLIMHQIIPAQDVDEYDLLPYLE